MLVIFDDHFDVIIKIKSHIRIFLKDKPFCKLDCNIHTKLGVALNDCLKNARKEKSTIKDKPVYTGEQLPTLFNNSPNEI